MKLPVCCNKCPKAIFSSEKNVYSLMILSYVPWVRRFSQERGESLSSVFQIMPNFNCRVVMGSVWKPWNVSAHTSVCWSKLAWQQRVAALGASGRQWWRWGYELSRMTEIPAGRWWLLRWWGWEKTSEVGSGMELRGMYFLPVCHWGHVSHAACKCTCITWGDTN